MSFIRRPATLALCIVLVGILALNARADTIISLSANVITDNPDGPDRLLPGDEVSFQIGVDVAVAAGNNGLNVLVYDVIALQTTPQLSRMLYAFSGFSNDGADVSNPGVGGAADVSDNYYNSSDNAISPDYGGGWGFSQSTLFAGGDVTTMPGSIIAAGSAAPFAWIADTHPNIDSDQPFVRPQIGVGAYTFGADDPVLAGLQGGFGFEISGVGNDTVITEGDGTWIMQEGHIDTTGWAPGTYTFDLNPRAGGVYDGTLDYSTDIATGWRIDVPTSDMTGTSFSFTIIPEPATLGLLLLAGLSTIRRRR